MAILTQEGPNIKVAAPTFGDPFPVNIERELYRIQLEGFIEEDPSDPSKVLILFLNPKPAAVCAAGLVRRSSRLNSRCGF